MIIFDDARGELGPLADLRASFELRSGALTTAERIAAARPEKLRGYRVPDHLAGLVAERAAVPVNAELPRDAGGVLCVNGRWAMPRRDLVIPDGEALIEGATGDVVAAHLSGRDVEALLESGEPPPGARRRELSGAVLYRHPWDVLKWLRQAIGFDIASLARRGAAPSRAAVVGDHPVDVHQSARLYPGVVLDAEKGPIRIEEGAVVRPGAVLCGPCFVGRDSLVADRALIKPNTVIGPVCKVGGEVGGTIFQGYSNKVHDGHLGDSWVGEWVNIGAGTTNSNLLNTYGEITMRLEHDGPLHRTGLQYVGAFIGDHAKLAIETRLGTGTVIGTGAMIATTGTAPQVVRRFAWLTDRGGQVFRFAKFLDTVRAMMSRRGVEPSDACVAALRALHEKTT